jgi:hypothetical protein
MCVILTLLADSGHPGVRQVLWRWGGVYEREDRMDPPDGPTNFSTLPEDARVSLMRFLGARRWSQACDVLEEQPSLIEPWASNCLRNTVLEGHLSEEDFAVFCAHIFVLDLAQTRGIEHTREFLDQLR